MSFSFGGIFLAGSCCPFRDCKTTAIDGITLTLPRNFQSNFLRAIRYFQNLGIATRGGWGSDQCQDFFDEFDIVDKSDNLFPKVISTQSYHVTPKVITGPLLVKNMFKVFCILHSAIFGGLLPFFGPG